MSIKALHLTGPPYWFFPNTAHLQAARQVSLGDYEAVGKSTNIQHILPISDTSLSISKA